MRIANICPVCATYINAACVIYTGAYLTNIDVSPNDPLDEILGSINDNLVPVVGNGAPAIPAIYIGQLYIDAGTSSIYYAKSIGGGAPDWILLSAGGVTPPPTIVSVLNQPLTSNTTTNVGAFSLNFITTNYPTSMFTVQDGQVLIGDSGDSQNGTSIVVDDNLQTVVINGNNGVTIGGDINNTEIFVDDTNQIINITSGNGVTINGQQIVRSVNGIFADGAGDVALPPFGIDDTLDQNQVLTASRSINVDTHVLEVITANYPGSFLSVQDGIIFFGDSALTVNGTSVMVDDNIQSIMLGTGGIASFQGNNNNTEITMDDGNEIITMVATNWATLNGNNIAVSVNGNFADASGNVTIAAGTPSLQDVLDFNHDLVNNINTQGTGAGSTQTGVSVNLFGGNAGSGNTGDMVNAFGPDAALGNTGDNVNAIGDTAGSGNTGSNCNFIGVNAGENNVGVYCDFVGTNAGKSNLGTNVVGIGITACEGNGSQDVIGIGNQAMKNNSGDYSAGIGFQAGFNNTGINTNAIGLGAGNTNTGTTCNFFGLNTGTNNTGNFVNAIGGSAASTNTGNFLNAFGDGAGFNNSGQEAIAVGSSAVRDNSGDRVYGFGNSASRNNSGDDVVGVGYQAAFNNTGNDVVAIGRIAGLGNGQSSRFIISNTCLPSFANFAAASAAITVGLGAVAGNTYLYHDQATNSIGAVRL